MSMDPRFEELHGYEAAKKRLRNEPELQPYEDILMPDWVESTEQWGWIVVTPVAELIDWASDFSSDGTDGVQAE